MKKIKEEAQSSQQKYIDESKRLFHWYGEPVPTPRTAVITVILIAIIAVVTSIF